MLFYFLRGSLPWSGLSARTQDEKYRKIKEKKIETPLTELGEGHPEEFRIYLEYCRHMKFKQKPDYNMLYGLFSAVRAQEGVDHDDAFQWFDDKDKSMLPPAEPLLPRSPDLKQPDEQTKRFRWCCFASVSED